LHSIVQSSSSFAPDDSDRELLDVRQIRFLHLAITRDNYRDVLKPLLTCGPGRGVGRYVFG
jgi:homospermidine synthase